LSVHNIGRLVEAAKNGSSRNFLVLEQLLVNPIGFHTKEIYTTDYQTENSFAAN
jgi:hypothetical protein